MMWNSQQMVADSGTKAAPASASTTVEQKVTPQPRRDLQVGGLVDSATKNEVAYACVQIKRKAMQDPRLIVQQKASDGTWKEVAGHPFARLMMRPLPDMDGATFMGIAVASWDIARVFYAEKVRSASGAVVGLNPLNPASMKPRFDQQRQQNGWIWKEGPQKIEFDLEDVLVRRQPAWADAAPLAVALGSVDGDSAQTGFIRAFFDNGGQPSGIIKVKGTYDQLKADALSSKWATKYGRRGDGWHRPAVLDDNAEYQKTGANLSELASETIVGIFESRICQAFGVPPLIIYAYVGLIRSTYSNLKEAWASFWDAELSPALKAWREFLTWHLLTEFVAEDLIYGGRIRLAWDLSEVAALQEDVDAIHARAKAAFEVGGLTLNEYRSRIGQPPDPAGDYYVRSSKTTTQPAGEQPGVALELPKRARVEG